MQFFCKVLSVITLIGISSQSPAQAAIITFSASNTVTWQVVTPDSIYIQNVTLGLDTTLRGVTSFDLNSLTFVPQPAEALPNSFAMSNNYPNGFTDKTDFSVRIIENDDLVLQVFNILGRQIAQAKMSLAAGEHAFTFSGGSLANGVYFVRASTLKETTAIKILKTGEQSAAPVEILYRGQGGGLALPTLPKAAAVSGDIFHFTLYADGYIPLRLESQQPVGGENYHFDLMPLPPPEDFTSNWRGFNLLGKFSVEWNNEGYTEEDFQMIVDFGFNFVRLPIDYRTYIEDDDWLSFDENALADIDDAVFWGQQYDIHVSINLHRAPGYCVNPPSSELPPGQDVSLWENETAQQVFAEHWRMFAERYKNVPREALSFNLINEPANVDGDTYVKAVLPAIQAIREISPNRIIISDAVDWGNARVDEILDYGVVMSPHFYQPMQITHYQASWVNGADQWPEPTWPPVLMPNYLYGSYKSPWNGPMIIHGDFKQGQTVVLHVQQVSTSADLRIRLDGKQIMQKNFQPGPGEGEWKEVIYKPEWDIYQNIYDRDYSVQLPNDGEELRIQILTGDWLTFSELRIEMPDGLDSSNLVFRPGLSDWGIPQAEYHIDENGALLVLNPPEGFEDKFIMNGFLQQWIDLKWEEVPVHVGEWGVYNKTPHDVTLAFMENRLKAMKAAGLGWALWNFRGSFGILDSGRSDVEYEDYRGHKLDRKMLQLLQAY